MSVVEELYDMIDRGRSGRNIGLSFGFPKLDQCIYGLQRGFITTLAGDSGSGKSSLALYMYTYRPIVEAIEHNKPINILYYSFEMASNVLLTKLLSMYIYEYYNIKLSYNKILSLSESLDDSSYELLQDCKEWITKVSNILEIVDKPVVPKAIYAKTMEWMEKFGKFESSDTYREKFVYNNPDQHLIVVVDHIALLASSENSSSKKNKIDEACDYMIALRNKANITFCIVQQLNRGFKNMQRRTEGGGIYSFIQLDDLADSAGPGQSSEIVLAIFDAYRERQKTCRGYDVSALKDSFRLLQVIKHRFGQSNKFIGMFFNGATGFWEELPSAEEVDYSRYLNKFQDGN